MATVRALNHILRRKPFVVPSVPLSPTSSCCFTTGKMCRSSSQKSVSKIDESNTGGQVSTTFAEVVKENTKSAWYVSVIIAGVGVTAVMFYAIFRELFSGKSPNSVYSKALDRIMKDPKVLDALGEPIKAFGEENRRGRRRHVNHAVYVHNNKQYMRMQFYVQGLRKRGTVHLEVREDDAGDFVYRYLFIELEDMLRTVIVVEDNRAAEMQTNKIEDVAPFAFPLN
ncbi:mitochondrial import inner membrane translocase subunit Tim21 [Fopius arisanus]|uniref:Mitochondrial import inner membrane translocase subunit Tim21 n=1 Tax=Fopius arisanus TaxID=64838 RepID=A0A0C9PZ64_9HYME|nr:PREDICTED: mitochondrial import inner membrane translocase subunit Tim21 [Fopius arisanus]XP_011300184.1 PREDICTED: mitochondrial import inner membrane translocase subunit Tim21 [Fopius arisanus]